VIGAETSTTESESRVADLVAHADDNLVLAQRLGEWISKAPELEEDIALGNIALDHLGVARALYTRAGEIEGKGRTEDDYAMRRAEREFLNVLLVEQPNGDFAHTMVRALFFDAYQVELWEGLSGSDDEMLAGIAARAGKEARYHLRHSSAWVVRLGDGTEESHRRSQSAVDALWRYTGTGTGTFLHLGMAWVSVTHCTFVDFASGTGTFGPGTIALTAANGDELHLVHMGTFSLVVAPDGLTSVFDMTWVVAGGTGRFAGATGAGTTHGSSLLSTGTTAASYEGEIAY